MTDDVKALIAEARQQVRSANIEGIFFTVTCLADALEAATVAPAVDREALVQAALRRLDNENHEALCSCSLWPSDCSTYGSRRPWSHDGKRLVEIALDDLLVSGILRDVRDVQAEALEQAAAHVEKLRAVEESVPAESATQSAMRSHLITEFEVLRDHFIECAQALREARNEH